VWVCVKAIHAEYAAAKGQAGWMRADGAAAVETIAEGKLIQRLSFTTSYGNLDALPAEAGRSEPDPRTIRMYVAGEIANGFSELNDPAEQERR